MTAETKRTILRALQNYRGDDYERASHAFRGLTPEQMQQPYGHSGQTKQAILDGYRQHFQRVQDAIREVEGETTPHE